MFQGTANTSLSCCSAWSDVMSAALFSGASTYTVPNVMSLMMRLRRGKFWASGRDPIGCSEITVPFSMIWDARFVCSQG